MSKVFVFGSNEAGMHGAGAAKDAFASRVWADELVTPARIVRLRIAVR